MGRSNGSRYPSPQQNNIQQFMQQGIPQGFVQQMSPQQAAELRIFLIHHREFINAQPAVIRIETTEGPFFKVLGGLSKLEQLAGTIAAGPYTPEESVVRASKILELCNAAHEAEDAAKLKAAHEAIEKAKAEQEDEKPSSIIQL